jgi:hypothetical protein
MNEKEFPDNYLWPSERKLNATFIHPLPNIKGLKKCGDFIIQCELEETFIPTIITKYVSDTLGVKLVEVYRNTQRKDAEVFVRLVGTISLVKTGYPFLLLDTVVANANLLTGKREGITTRVLVNLPQADSEQRKMVFNSLNKQAREASISCEERQFDFAPDFQGPTWMSESKGIDLDMIRQLRDNAWSAYKYLIEQTKEKTPFDYQLLQKHMIFNVRKEERLFKGIGVSVSVEANAALLSVLVSSG